VTAAPGVLARTDRARVTEERSEELSVESLFGLSTVFYCFGAVSGSVSLRARNELCRCCFEVADRGAFLIDSTISRHEIHHDAENVRYILNNHWFAACRLEDLRQVKDVPRLSIHLWLIACGLWSLIVLMGSSG
jgi:hypothetical protein